MRLMNWAARSIGRSILAGVVWVGLPIAVLAPLIAWFFLGSEPYVTRASLVKYDLLFAPSRSRWLALSLGWSSGLSIARLPTCSQGLLHTAAAVERPTAARRPEANGESELTTQTA